MDPKNKNLGLFMTRNMSLSTWGKLGMLERELRPYIELSKYFRTIYIFSYGSYDEKFSYNLPTNVIIVTKPRFIGSFFYSFLLPFIHRKIFKKIDIIKTNQMDGSWAAVISKKIFHVKLVVRCGYEWLLSIEKAKKYFLKRWIAKIVEYFAYTNADKIILTSEESKRFVLENFSVHSPRIEIIPNYIDTDLFKPLDMPREKNRIIFVGRLENEKNLINLFYSLEGVDASLVVIGDGSLRPSLEKITKDKGLDVIFMGIVPQALLPYELNKSELFILPSLYEGNPKALLEAMASGLACIGTNVDGIGSLIKHGENGFLTTTDVESLRMAITTLLENKELCDTLGRNARVSIEKDNSLPSFISRELHIYTSLLHEKSL